MDRFGIVRAKGNGCGAPDRGRLTKDLPVSDDGELGQLTRTFNPMCSDLQEKELRFARAIDDAPFPIMIHAEDGTVHKTNRVWTELTGYDPSQIPTITAWTERAYGQRMAVAKSRIDRLYTHNRRVHEGEFELTTRSGDKRVWDFSSAPLGTTSDGKRLVLSMAVDITDRKAAEHARKHAYDDLEKQVVRRTEQLVAANETLRASEERLDLAVRGTSDGLWDADLETGRGYWSPRFKELLGYKEDEIEATFDEFLALLHPEDRADVREAIRLHLEEKRPYDCEFRMRTKSGHLTVLVDEIQIQQVLVNLIRNAVDAMQETPSGQREVTVSSRILPDGYAEVTVSDVGKGLSQDELEQVFTAFFQQSKKAWAWDCRSAGLLLKHIVEG